MATRTDRELLAAWRETGDESAFAELVARHRQMVYRTSLRMLGSVQDTEDAVQAVFVVLAQKADRLQREGSLGGWLHTVTRHVAMQALARRASHARREKELVMWSEADSEASSPNADTSIVLRCLDQELAGLSAVLREAVVLRYLQGNSEKAAAELAGCPLGTLSWRASKGIAKLRLRLSRRGIALSGAALAGLLASEVSAAVPETLFPSILATLRLCSGQAVKSVAAGAATTGLASVALGAKEAATTKAAMLAKGAMKAMFIAKVKMVAAVAAAVIVTGTAVPVGIVVAQAVGKEEESPAKKTDVDAMLKQAQDLLSQGKKAEANGDASLGQKQYKAAADLFLQVQKEYEAHPLAPKALLLAGQCQMRMKDDKAAIQTLETLLQTYPDAKAILPEVLYWLGDCYSRAKDPAAAKRVWEKLNSEFPESNWGKYARGRLTEY